MKSVSDEKLAITDKDSLRRRHSGSYKSLKNGEIYQLPYEAELATKPPSFFDNLSDFDYLKNPASLNKLSLKALRTELMRLDDGMEGADFWKNFNDSALKSHLNIILDTVKNEDDKDWRKKYLKQTGESDDDKPHHNDMLRCIYLLAHMHKASPSYIRQLSKVDCVWSTDLRVYYPRTDFAFSEEYGGYLSELYANILYHQPTSIRKAIKYLDKIIEKLVQFSDSWLIAPILKGRSADTDSPGLKILKYNQIASITHFQALNQFLSDKITGNFTDNSFAQLEANGTQNLATAQHYRLVAAQCLRMKMGVPSKKRNGMWYPVSATPCSQTVIDDYIKLFSNALAADALNKLEFESDGSKSGKKDTSISSAIKKMACQNPQSIDAILASESLDCSNVPEIFSKYTQLRAMYSEATKNGSQQNLLRELRYNARVKCVLEYIKGNNIVKINSDIESIEKTLAVMKFVTKQSDIIDNSTLIYEYGLHNLPPRKIKS
ncbi:hypothetical protein ACROUB_003618 [Yersinia enterocolitica]